MLFVECQWVAPAGFEQYGIEVEIMAIFLACSRPISVPYVHVQKRGLCSCRHSF